MSKFQNKKKKSFLNSLDLPSLLDMDNDLVIRCKFNFSYFTSEQNAGQKFSDWTDKQLCELLEKIKGYTTKPLEYWRNQRVGSGGLKVLVIYGDFPKKSSFNHPKHVLHQAQ